MKKRRTFIKTGLTAAAALAVKPFSSLALPRPSGKVTKPIVLSTWNSGIRANEEAWKILSAGGRSLDAVEKGVMIIESDPEERSVGYGGRPDRDGRVTLDACIMDE